ncbi:MAG: MFS transporter, partial [Bacteroidota bacterium]|nr:MFS transporter [Bacteroidota bacterium]
ITSKEYSPKELEDFNISEDSDSNTINKQENYTKIGSEYKLGFSLVAFGLLFSLLLFYFDLKKELYILAIAVGTFGILELLTALLKNKKKTKNGLVSIITDFNNMPKTMKQLALVQFFSWFALFAMWIYTTAGVTSHIYGTSDTTSELYNNGANWVGVCFGIYNGFAALFAFLLIYLAKITNRKATHSISLVIGGLSLISIYFVPNPDLLIFSFVGVGLAWASILAMPYAILTGSLPSNKMGVYMGIFNFFIVIPQILAASILGFIIKDLFNGEAIYALILGGISMFIASILILFVKDED